MDLETLRNYCLSKPFASEDMPFGEDFLAFRVLDKIFGIISLKQWEEGKQFINLKCNPDKAIELRENYEGIKPGYHMNKKHWNSVGLNFGDISPSFLKELIDHSYTCVVEKMPKKQRELIISS
ncbi:MAG: MmcQ/YjbR family DNA-binding protein [Bergeyella zoohelcum]|nr:MmcQ/YjbR family DNA-binding protein [Bergeyella zoohelcum]